MRDGGSFGQVIDALGVKPTTKDGDLVVGCVVLIKVVEADGTVRLSQAWSEGMSWIERVGMLHVARVTEDETTSME
jgi:hypothetical protein